MRFQELSYSCGAATVLNCLKLFDKHTEEPFLRKLCNTTKNGTDEKGIVSALHKFKLKTKECEFTNFKIAFSFILNSLSLGCPLILCFDKWAHWVLAAGKLNKKIIIIDSTNEIKNKKENGIHIYSPKQLMQRWKYKKDKKNIYYAIQVIGK